MLELFCCTGLQRVMLSGCNKKFVWIAKKVIVVWIKKQYILFQLQKSLIDVDCTQKLLLVAIWFFVFIENSNCKKLMVDYLLPQDVNMLGVFVLRAW
jgi:hypothetical protein